MQAAWDFLLDPANRETLTWLGGGVAAVCGGLWAMITFLAKPTEPAKAPASPRAGAGSVRADRGGVAAGRDVSIRKGVDARSVVLLVLAAAGAVVAAVALIGPGHQATNGGVVIGGDARGVDIDTAPSPGAAPAE
jgi:hypothetical protein